MSKPSLKDLQELVHAGVISANTAQDITNYYLAKKDSSANRFNTILGLLGSLLIGSGIILVVAHNWDDLGRVSKTFFAFLPLVTGQGLCLYTLLRKKESVVWRESSAAILFFAVASCISLVSQVYHISGTLADFIFTWLLLTFPLIYLLPSALVSLLYIAAGTWYACLVGYPNILSSDFRPFPYRYFILLLLVVPHYYGYIKNNRNSNFFHLHNWLLSLSFTIALAAFAGSYTSYPWIFAGYSALFGVFYLLGTSAYFREQKLFLNPFLILGLLGSLFILMAWSYDLLWTELTISRTNFEHPFIYIILLLLTAIIYLIIHNNKKRAGNSFDPVGFTPIIFSANLFVFHDSASIGIFIINIWILLIALFYIRKGSNQNHLGILNFGLLIIALLAVLRFFDDSIPFIWRGIFFVATGIGFFVANYSLLKKRKTVNQTN